MSEKAGGYLNFQHICIGSQFVQFFPLAPLHMTGKPFMLCSNNNKFALSITLATSYMFIEYCCGCKIDSVHFLLFPDSFMFCCWCFSHVNS